MNNSNPLLREDVFKKTRNEYAIGDVQTMTVNGTINKSLILWVILALSAWFAWINPQVSMPLTMPFIITGFIVAMIIIFKKNLAPALSPVYALCEGLILGAVSLSFERQYPGIVINAVLLTMCVLFFMLGAYRTGIIRPTAKFRMIITAGMFAILVVYILDLILSFFGTSVAPLHSSGPLGIFISLVIVAVAGFSLILDFDMIRYGEEAGAPKFMEWYGAFSLMVTLVWLYLEILRLLAKTRR
jgi:uncharacterized YccA/Bax inhibitor family protein